MLLMQGSKLVHWMSTAHSLTSQWLFCQSCLDNGAHQTLQEIRVQWWSRNNVTEWLWLALKNRVVPFDTFTSASAKQPQRPSVFPLMRKLTPRLSSVRWPRWGKYMYATVIEELITDWWNNKQQQYNMQCVFWQSFHPSTHPCIFLTREPMGHATIIPTWNFFSPFSFSLSLWFVYYLLYFHRQSVKPEGNAKAISWSMPPDGSIADKVPTTSISRSEGGVNTWSRWGAQAALNYGSFATTWVHLVVE